MEKECSCDCKIKHAKVWKCQDVDFPTPLHICLVTQSLITQLHAAFPTEFLHPSVLGVPAVVSREAIQYFIFLLLPLMTLFRLHNEGGIMDALMVLFFAHLHDSISVSWTLFPVALSDPGCCPDPILKPWECKNIEDVFLTNSFTKLF